MVSITRLSIARIVPRQARLPMLILFLTITIPFSVTVHNLKTNERLLKASLRRKDDFYSGDYIIGFAVVEPSQDAELNRFVASQFSEAAMCSWSFKAVICQVGNITKPYAVMKNRDPYWEQLSRSKGSS